jgi:hypothetical protein
MLPAVLNGHAAFSSPARTVVVVAAVTEISEGAPSIIDHIFCIPLLPVGGQPLPFDSD